MLWKIWRSKKRKKMSCWNCVSASERMAFTFSLQTCIQIGMCDTSVTAPPGLSVCCHLWGVSSAFARVSISQTVVRPQNSHALPTLNCCQDNFVCKHLLHFRCSSCLFLPLFSSHFPPSSTPPVLHSLRLSAKFLTFVTKTRDCECARMVYVWWRPWPQTCGVFEPAGPPLSPTSHPLVHWSGVHLLSVCTPAFPTHTRTPHYATSSFY